MPVEIHIPQPEFGHPAELAMLSLLANDGEALISRYLARETKAGVVFIARDAAKRMFAEYNADRTNNNRYSDRAASALADAVRRFILSRPVEAPREEVIIFTGTPASGKSFAGRPVCLETVEFVHETIFTSMDKATSILREAFQAKRRPTISLIYTDDPRINVRRMIGRARRIGRTVPLTFMAETFVAVPRLVSALQKEFGSSLKVLCANNSGRPEEVILHNSIETVLEVTEGYTYGSCLRVMDNELQQINEGEPIPFEILREARLR